MGAMNFSPRTTTPKPYNVTIQDNSPTITYLPYRDGPLTGGWNVTCAGSDDATWAPQTFCVGPSSHRTSYEGASLSFDFVGTAAYLFGTGSPGSYAFYVDGQLSSSSASSLGLLAKVEQLSYGLHTLSFNVTQANLVAFNEVVFTIGIGTGGSVSGPTNRTIIPFNVSDTGVPELNPVFTYTGSWTSVTPGGIGATGNTLYPRQNTGDTGASITFTLNETSAFFIYGLVNTDLSQFIAVIQPPSDLGPTITTTFNSSSRWISLDEVMFWYSGLDRNRQYTISITNEGQGNTPWWDFSRVDVIDGNPSEPSPIHEHRLSAAATGGIIAGAVVLVLVLVACFFNRKRIRRTIYPDDNSPSQLYANYKRSSLDHADLSNYYEAYQPPYESTPMLPVQPHPAFLDASQQHSEYSPAPGPQISPRPHPLSPPLAAPEGESSSRPSYHIASQGGLVALSWNEEQSTSNITITDEGSRKGGSPRVVQEEDGGGVFSPSENVVRLPPGYQESWSEGR